MLFEADYASIMYQCLLGARFQLHVVMLYPPPPPLPHLSLSLSVSLSISLSLRLMMT